MTGRVIRSVTWLNTFVRDLLSAEPNLSPILLEGEISGGKLYPSGHYYFTLKDEQSQVSCVLFGLAKKGLDFRPADGQRVIADGLVTVYPPSGRFQLNVRTMRLAGRGALYERFLRLKEVLAKEGLFAEHHKRPLPSFPKRIGVVTSEKGAVLSDIIQVLRQRQPGFSLLLYPVAVQGETAAAEITEAINLANRRAEVDVLIVGRGGGSFEDLFAFNEEKVVRAIFSSAIPIVAAVGHETDFTLAELAADLRAPTPTAAAFAVSIDQAELLTAIRTGIDTLGRLMYRRLEQEKRHLKRLTDRPALSVPERIIEVRQQRLDMICRDMERILPRLVERAGDRLEGLIRRFSLSLPVRLGRAKERLARFSGRLGDLGPERVLARGYAIVSHADGRVLMKSSETSPGHTIHVRLYRGSLDAKVTEVHNAGDETADKVD